MLDCLHVLFEKLHKFYEGVTYYCQAQMAKIKIVCKGGLISESFSVWLRSPNKFAKSPS